MKKRNRTIPFLLTSLSLILAACGAPTSSPDLQEAASIPASVQQEASPFKTLTNAIGKDGYTVNLGKATQSTQDGLTITSVPLEEIAGYITYVEEKGEIDWAQLSLFTKGGAPINKWAVCHVPPGNPSKAHTIYVGQSALKAHVGRHGGDTLGFCPSDMAADPSLGITAIVVARKTPPILTKATYDDQGEIVLLENGEAVGTNSLTELTTLKIEVVEPEVKDTTIADLADFLRETLGENATPYLEAIPKSMGGTGPELNSESSSILRPQGPTGPCGRNGGECRDEPEEGDPEPEPEPDPEPSPEPEPEEDSGGDEGEEGGGNNDDDDNEEDDPERPSYDKGELERLEDEVENWQGAVDVTNELIEEIDEEIAEQKEQQDEFLALLDEMIIEGTPTVTEIQQGIDKVRESIVNVENDLRGDNLGIGAGVVGIVVSCSTANIGCLASAVGTDYALESRREHRVEKEGYIQEKEELTSERDGVIGSIQEVASDFQETQTKIIKLDGEREDAEEILELVEGNLKEAEGKLGRFKNRYDID